MNVIHVIPGLDRDHGGPSVALPRLCQQLAAKHVSVKIHACSGDMQAAKFSTFETIFHSYMGFFPKLRLSSSLLRTVLSEAKVGDVIHSHGLWTFPNFAAQLAASRSKIPHVITPRGMLSSWALNQSNYRKKLAMLLFQRSALENADCLIATSKLEESEIRAAGFRTAVALIPHGIDVPEGLSSAPLLPNKRLLFISRIDPKKGIELLLAAWRSLSAIFEDWELVIAGSGENPYVDKLCSVASTMPRVRFVGYADSIVKFELFSKSDVFVLPSYSENFGIVIAEALAHGIPVVTTSGTPWANIETMKCGWIVPVGDSEALYQALKLALSMNAKQRTEVFHRARKWMREMFSWEACAVRTMEVYNWIVDRKSGTPSNVSLGA